MPTIARDSTHQTVITTFDVMPGTCHDLVDLLRVAYEDRALVDSLVTQGVRFSVCGNTLDTIEHETGQRPKINPHAIEVQVGVGQLLTLSEGGYTVIRP